jgi:superfamily II DNA or RNA helicase
MGDRAKVFDKFQSEAVEAIVRDFTKKKNGRYLLVIPTGGGKTRTAVKAINALFQNNILDSSSDRVLWVSHRVELENQAEKAFSKHAEINKNLKSFDQQVIYERDIRKIGRRVADQNIKIVVIDEAHHSAASSYQPIFDRSAVGVLGLTATPSRHDGKPLNFDKESYSIGFPDLIQQKIILAPIIEPPIKTGHKDTADHFDKLDKSKLNNIERNKKIISVLEKYHEKYNKVVIYVGTKDHVKDLYIQITNSSLLKEKYSSINWILGGENNNSRRLPRKIFIEEEKSEKKTILINIDVLTEGYDDPTIDTVVMACPMKSALKYMQAAGRAVRTDENNEAKKAYIVPVEDDLPNIRYRFDNRWLYSDISDALEPQVIDKTYSDEATFREVFDTLYNTPETLVNKKDQFYPPYDKDTRYSVLLFKVYLTDGFKHLPIILNNENRLKFKNRFDWLSERLAHDNSFFDRNYSSAFPPNELEAFEILKEDLNRRSVWEAMTLAGQCIENSKKPASARILEQKPWITFVALRYRANEVPLHLQSFLENMVNKYLLEEDIKGKNYEPSSKLVKLPLPMGLYKGLILNHETFVKVQKMVNEIQELFNASENKDYLDELIQYFDSSDFPIQLKYKQCLPIIIREQLDYFMELELASGGGA